MLSPKVSSVVIFFSIFFFAENTFSGGQRSKTAITFKLTSVVIKDGRIICVHIFIEKRLYQSCLSYSAIPDQTTVYDILVILPLHFCCKFPKGDVSKEQIQLCMPLSWIAACLYKLNEVSVTHASIVWFRCHQPRQCFWQTYESDILHLVLSEWSERP